MAASVWMTSWMVRPVTAVISRPSALTTPVVRVWSRPKGLPMANTFCPTCRSCDSPTVIGRSLSAGAVICSTARSRSGAAPTSTAFQELLIGQGHLQPVGVGDHVVVGDDPPLLVPDEARAGPLGNLLDVEAEQVASHGDAGDVDHRGGGVAEDVDGVALVAGQVAARLHRPADRPGIEQGRAKGLEQEPADNSGDDQHRQWFHAHLTGRGMRLWRRSDTDRSWPGRAARATSSAGRTAGSRWRRGSSAGWRKGSPRFRPARA